MSKTRKPYPSDLTDAEWDLVRPLLPRRKHLGRRPTVDRRDLLDAVFYLVRTGCQWRQLPHDFPPWGTVASQFHRWKKDGTWVRVHNVLRGDLREAEGRDREPTAAIIDSQSAKTTEQGGPRGYDAAKKVSGRKRHLGVDSGGLLLAVAVTAASVQDYDGARLLLQKLKWLAPKVRHLWADAIYALGGLADWAWHFGRWVLEIVRRPAGAKGFALLPRRWVVERTLAWLCRQRRRSKDYEGCTRTSEMMVYIAMTRLMVARLARKNTG